jgi:cell division protein FtsA
MDTRIGFPNEHLAGDSDDEVTSPLYATAVGLVMDGLKRQEKRKQEAVAQKAYEESVIADDTNDDEVIEKPVKERKTFLDKLTERVKDFLDNAE